MRGPQVSIAHPFGVKPTTTFRRRVMKSVADRPRAHRTGWRTRVVPERRTGWSPGRSVGVAACSRPAVQTIRPIPRRPDLHCPVASPSTLFSPHLRRTWVHVRSQRMMAEMLGHLLVQRRFQKLVATCLIAESASGVLIAREDFRWIERRSPHRGPATVESAVGRSEPALPFGTGDIDSSVERGRGGVDREPDGRCRYSDR